MILDYDNVSYDTGESQIKLDIEHGRVGDWYDKGGLDKSKQHVHDHISNKVKMQICSKHVFRLRQSELRHRGITD